MRRAILLCLALAACGPMPSTADGGFQPDPQQTQPAGMQSYSEGRVGRITDNVPTAVDPRCEVAACMDPDAATDHREVSDPWLDIQREFEAEVKRMQERREIISQPHE